MPPNVPALGPIPEVAFMLQMAGFFGALGVIAAARSYGRTGDPDRRWLVAARWATFGLGFGFVMVVSHATVGVP